MPRNVNKICGYAQKLITHSLLHCLAWQHLIEICQCVFKIYCANKHNLSERVKDVLPACKKVQIFQCLQKTYSQTKCTDGKGKLAARLVWVMVLPWGSPSDRAQTPQTHRTQTSPCRRTWSGCSNRCAAADTWRRWGGSDRKGWEGQGGWTERVKKGFGSRLHFFMC